MMNIGNAATAVHQSCIVRWTQISLCLILLAHCCGSEAVFTDVSKVCTTVTLVRGGGRERDMTD